MSVKNTSTMSLREMQKAFYEGIFNPNNTENLSELGHTVATTNAPLTAEDRIEIYRDSILGGITEALTSIYPVCVKLVGETYFTHMVAGYLTQYASGSPDLGDYGEHLAQYIADFTPAKELFYMPDVAQLEWHWHKAFNAEESGNAQAIQFTVAELANLSEEQQPFIQFCLSPSASLMSSAYPVHKIWQVNQDDYQGDQMVNLDDGGVRLVIWRSPDYGMRIDVLNDSEHEFLSALYHQQAFGDVAQLPCATDINELLPKFIQMGLIVGFNLADG
ncbi:HvfC/BufC N-terminal domain-containing protein [Litoribrevibacter albus]|uniref:Putative DNA-binding domain-containing protein n=1 Tax=Litoribrevibacter albus TaxID=1473156 RepID=A0AA37S822_9GAMM|nr:DNA-binding domain-containing protein [Litoribrevibacter albus]GLQ30024.1 hypothetical protein GCM10007876_05020 [Litoribrevibacter albus]